MECGPLIFPSLADAIAALHSAQQPLVLTRFKPEPAARIVIAVNATRRPNITVGSARRSPRGAARPYDLLRRRASRSQAVDVVDQVDQF
jgi:hypothetical protein